MSFNELSDILWAVFILAGIVTLIIWLVVMNRAIDQISHDIRRMEPGAVWLCLLPLFGLVWQFIVTNAVADGIARELQVRNMFPKEAKPGYAMGLTGGILLCCIIIPYGGVGMGLIGLVFMILHLVKISEYNKILKESGRWEMRYNDRMQAMRQQQYHDWQYKQQPYQPPYHQAYQQPHYQQPQTYIPPQPVAPPPPHRSTNIPEVNPKEKPKNPFE